MAELNERLTQNVNGAYYVDSTCIDCDLCRAAAPQFFKRDEDIGTSIVFLQPITPEECVIAEEALLGCPTDSIGNDGSRQIPHVSK
jgi:ferredoxin